MYERLGIFIALAALFSINAVASMVITILWRPVARYTRRWSAVARAEFLFALRIFPPASALLFVGALLIPSYIIYEPRRTSEVISIKLFVLAFFSMVGIMLAVWQCFAAWYATRRILSDWLPHSEPIYLEDISLPAFRLQHPFPVIAVVGTIRPRLFVADHLFELMSEGELSAALMHEVGHIKAQDNFKRAVLRACRDALTIIPCGRSLDHAWAENAEAAADEYVARSRPMAALDLAAVLVKVARLIPAGAKPSMPAGAFLIGEHAVGGIGWRVRRLTKLAEGDVSDKTPVTQESKFIVLASLCGFIIAVALIITNYNILLPIHVTMERLLSALQ